MKGMIDYKIRFVVLTRSLVIQINSNSERVHRHDASHSQLFFKFSLHFFMKVISLRQIHNVR